MNRRVGYLTCLVPWSCLPIHSDSHDYVCPGGKKQVGDMKMKYRGSILRRSSQKQMSPSHHQLQVSPCPRHPKSLRCKKSIKKEAMMNEELDTPSHPLPWPFPLTTHLYILSIWVPPSSFPKTKLLYLLQGPSTKLSFKVFSKTAENHCAIQSSWLWAKSPHNER